MTVTLEVVGSGRCGTRWLAGVLQRAGLSATHEGEDPSAAIDVSWLRLTAPDQARSTARLVLVRHPYDTIASLTTCGLFSDPYYMSHIRRITGLLQPFPAWIGNDANRAAWWWRHVYGRAAWPAAAIIRAEQPHTVVAAIRAVEPIVRDTDTALDDDFIWDQTLARLMLEAIGTPPDGNSKTEFRWAYDPTVIAGGLQHDIVEMATALGYGDSL